MTNLDFKAPKAYVDPMSLNVQTIVAALQTLDLDSASGSERDVGEMTLAELVVALKQVGINIGSSSVTKAIIESDRVGHTGEAAASSSVGQSGGTVSQQGTSGQRKERTAEQVAASQRRLRAIELTFLKLDKASIENPKRALNTSPIDVSSEDEVDKSLDLLPCDPANLSDLDMSEFGTIDTSRVASVGTAEDTGEAGVAENIGGDLVVAVNGSGEILAEVIGGSGHVVDVNVGCTLSDGESPPSDPVQGLGKFDAKGNLKGYVCHNCKTYNVVVPSSEAWYVVVKGKSVGVYKGWDVVAPMVQGVSMAIYSRVDTKDVGDYLFQQAVLLGNVEIRPY